MGSVCGPLESAPTTGVSGARQRVRTTPVLSACSHGLIKSPVQQRRDRHHVEGVPPSNRGQDARDTTGPPILWLLDSPVSNSGRLKTLLGQLARDNGWPWEVRLTISPDAELSKINEIVVSTDSVILDACQRWTNLAAEIITHRLPSTTIIDLT